MKKSLILKIYLALSGLLLVFIGAATLFNPIEIKASSGIDLAGNASLLNDIRATSALILVLALILVSGVFKKGNIGVSSLISFTVFLSLGTGRLISILIDGMPAESMVKATGLEFILGIIGLVLFIASREKIKKS